VGPGVGLEKYLCPRRESKDPTANRFTDTTVAAHKEVTRSLISNKRIVTTHLHSRIFLHGRGLGYGLVGRRFDSWQGKRIFIFGTRVQTGSGIHMHRIKRVSGDSPLDVKRQSRETDHSLPLNA